MYYKLHTRQSCKQIDRYKLIKYMARHLLNKILIDILQINQIRFNLIVYRMEFDETK